MNNLIKEYISYETRRQFFNKLSSGLGIAALSSLIQKDLISSEKNNIASNSKYHYKPKAKRAISLFMAGAPSQIDLLDYKPKLSEWYNKELPDSIRKGQRLTGMTANQKTLPVAPSIYKFNKHGESGTFISELMPYTAKMVDDISIIKTVHTEAINHDPAITYIQTGSQIPGKPSIGAWISYGLGSENNNLPSFVVLNSKWSAKLMAQALFQRLWGAGFLPSKHQGVALRSSGDPVLYLSNPKGIDSNIKRVMLNGIREFNENNYNLVGDPEIHSRISQYEMSFRMQSSVPGLTDLSDEPKYILDMYGPNVTTPGTFAYNCLLARRMAERDVRFTQIFHRGWDQHNNLTSDLPLQVEDIDQPSWALVQDLKMRGMLDDTLVLWGGEFGRTVYSQGKLTPTNYGRDHHPRCFSIWMAGGGIKGGYTHGQTDDFSYNIIKDPVHIRDLNATILHLLGIDHTKLSVKHQGLDDRLTGVEEAHVIKDLIV